MYAHDPQHTSYNPDETSISIANVGELVQAWRGYIGIGKGGYPAFSAPSVAGGMVYVGSSEESGDNFFAFDAQTGSPIWSAFIGFNPEECFLIGVGSTAAISGTLVVTGGGDGAYYGLDAITGAQIWRDPLGVGPSGFAWASPLLANGRAYVGVASDCDNPSVRGEVRALNIVDGSHITSQYIVPKGEAGAGIWQSAAISPDGTKIIEATGEDFKGYHGEYTRALVVLDANTLDIVAHNQQGVPDQDQDWNTSPIIFHDKTGRLLVGAGHKVSGFFAYDLNDVSAGPVWSWSPGLVTGTPPAYDPTFGDGGTLFFISQRNRLHAIDPFDGSERWPSVHIGDTHGHVAIANGLIYINRSGMLLIIDERDGHILRSITVVPGGRAYTGPVVSHGMVYWTSGPHLNAWTIPAPVCPSQFEDVQPGSTFYPYVNCLTCRGVVSGYDDGTFRPYGTVTRSQISKIVALSAGFGGDPGPQTYEDVPSDNIFFYYVQNLSNRDIMSGYPCGGENEPCGSGNLPYFRPYANAVRGQISKIVSNAAGYNDNRTGQTFQDVPPSDPFYLWIERLVSRGIMGGYPCGGENEPCGSGNLPYFRPYNDVTRGQASKIVANTFFPNCQSSP
jgi:outer membrane protein assembly factor BamB